MRAASWNGGEHQDSKHLRLSAAGLQNERGAFRECFAANVSPSTRCAAVAGATNAAAVKKSAAAMLRSRIYRVPRNRRQ